MNRTVVSSSWNYDWYDPSGKIHEEKKRSSKDKTYVVGWPCVRVRFFGDSDRETPCKEYTNSLTNRCDCYHSCRHSISPPDRRVMGLGIPDPWVQHPVLVGLKSPLKIEDEKWKEQCEERREPGIHLHRRGELPMTPYQCVHLTSGWPPPVGLCEAFRQLCNCFHRRKVRKCLHCGCRVHKGEECSVCTRSSNHCLEREMHPICTYHGVEHATHEERPRVSRRRLCCQCRAKIKKALATDVGTQTDKISPPEKKLPPVEKEERIVCCKHKKSKSSERSRKCPCCRRRSKKGEECLRCREPPVQVPQPKKFEVRYHCCTESKVRPVTDTRKKPPKDSRKKICCLCHSKLKKVKVKTVEVGTQTDVSRPKKEKLQPSPVKKKKKRKTVCCKHRKEVDDGGADQPKLMNEKHLFEALYRCWNDHSLAVSPTGHRNGAQNISGISIPRKLNLKTCDSAESTLTLWSKSSELLVISPGKSQPTRAENVTVMKGKGIEKREQTSGKMCGMSTKGCQTSFELLIHLIHTRRPEIVRWFAESALKEISSSNRHRTNKKHCLHYSE